MYKFSNKGRKPNAIEKGKIYTTIEGFTVVFSQDTMFCDNRVTGRREVAVNSTNGWYFLDGMWQSREDDPMYRYHIDLRKTNIMSDGEYNIAKGKGSFAISKMVAL